jgi:methionyl-tRNA formyltransferase
LQNRIEVLQPESLKDNNEVIQLLKDLQPDLIVVVAYGLILPKEVIAIPKFGVVNVHASLLPKYRGASPIQAAILNGDNRAGVTIMLIDELLDHGPILSQKDLKVSKNETFATLHDKLAALGAKLLTKTLPDYLNGKIKPQEQDQSLATFCKKITKEDGKIDLITSPIVIERQVRAFNPWPGTWLNWNGKKLKLLKIKIINDNKHEIGEVFKTKKGFAVVCIEDSLEILELQLEGKKPMAAKEFLNGYPGIIGSVLK